MNQKIALITGITGQDGAYLAELLLDKGYIVHGIKRRASLFNTDRIDHLYLDPHSSDARMFLHYGDMTDSMNLTRIIQETQPDEIYNLAAMSHVKVSFDTPEYTANADGIGTLRILEAVRLLGLEKKTKIYQASTSELYGLVQEVPQSENTPFYPRSPYAVAKLYGYWITVNYREAYDMFGINFAGHPMLRRILLPTYWEGHPLRKEYSARATEYTPYMQDQAKQDFEQEHLRFVPEDWGLKRGTADEDFMFLNLGPNHPSAHGAFRIVLQLDGEEVKDCVPDIGYHHRGVEKMAERQTWHSFIPYTDRVDYLGGCAQNMPYVMAVEQLAGIKVPERAQVIRVMLNELFRINNHLLFCGTAIQDAGGMTPVFYMFADRQKVYDIVEAITGYRMHPAWFRIGGTAHDLPNNWQKLVKELLEWMPKRLNEYYTAALKNSVFIGRTRNVAQYDAKSALAWGVTGTGLRATGIDFDVRKYRPYSGYENFDFDVPVEYEGDAYARVLVHFREITESLKIIQQCLDNMPSGPYKADHPLAVPPPKDKTLQDIETLITHFLSVSWGPVMPAGESSFMTEVVKGASTYYLTSDKSTMSYRTRIRTPTFTHLQQMPSVINGSLMSDLIIYLATIDVVMADVDR